MEHQRIIYNIEKEYRREVRGKMLTSIAIITIAIGVAITLLGSILLIVAAAVN